MSTWPGRFLILALAVAHTHAFGKSRIAATPLESQSFRPQEAITQPKPQVVGAPVRPVTPFSPQTQALLQRAVAAATPTAPMQMPAPPVPVPSDPNATPENNQALSALQQAFSRFMAGTKNSPATDNGVPSFTGGPDSENFSPGRNLSPEEEKKIEEDLSKYPIISSCKNPPASSLNCSHPTDNLTCMACNIYFEARGEPFAGQVKVGQSVVTRMYSSPYVNSYGGSACDQIYAYKQYSWTMLLSPSQKVMHDAKSARIATTAACQALGLPPTGKSNYYNPKAASPKWGVGECANSANMTGSHLFCDINATRDRTPAQVAAANRDVSTELAGDSDASR